MTHIHGLNWVGLTSLSLLMVLFACSCQFQREVNIDKFSPNGTYRVKVRLWQERLKDSFDYKDHIRVQYFKGQEIIVTYENQDEDQYERSIREGAQVVEWVSDNVVRIGRDRAEQPFSDELVISNNTNEPLKQLGVSYGKYQSL